MSLPKNHHYISQVHIRNFFNVEDHKIYVYDKLKKKFYSKTTSKSLFSEEFSNSRYIDGKVDHISLEKELNDFFEKDFAKNTAIIQEFVNTKDCNSDVLEALSYFAKYGIISEMRTPWYKKQTDEAIFGIFKELRDHAVPALKAEIDEGLQFENHVKYSNIGSYMKTANKILEKMGKLIFQVLIADHQDYFFIPDFGAATAREKINQYFNPDIKEIAYIGLPLTSKIYINYYSEKLYENHKVPMCSAIHCTSSAVTLHNKANIEYCHDKIACENEFYLKDFINSINI